MDRSKAVRLFQALTMNARVLPNPLAGDAQTKPSKLVVTAAQR